VKDQPERCAVCGQPEPLARVRPAAERLPQYMIGWANQMAARFGRPVFLVGSALRLPDPRDYDVRIVLSDDEFRDRYGDPHEYEAGTWLPHRFPSMLRYYADMAKLTQQAVAAIRLNIDFQVHPRRFAYGYREQPRRRLDQLGDAVQELPWETQKAPSSSPPT